ncbi:anaerobic ribonucleoside-triphosphate reductase activating protein [Flavobacterium sp. K5-23]|uniref:anaerobic ribonucleoside-triphosphate reductase activating protein n=1 Tax=Flavobacterium sp. K5-23 TaxID=2746225 RepID=UPI00200C78D3|nr:anaerobic ribonucleoside-triphosphate reductase activating protein [Flavobacterium sp. K5-23]UQD54955.1 anaerobic ribonucleoside-triphosphate reductase activating protein [Flavobacterium sp. K5-23]
MKENAVKPIFSITPFTLLDYPHKSACIIWFAGCNMRCLYCYNPEIVLGKGTVSYEKAITFLQSRQNLLDAVVFSGGECLLHKDIVSLIDKVKKMGFLVKVDTNGSKPEMIQKLIEKKLIDYVALDFKAMPSTFEKITQSNFFVPFEKSLHLLLDSGISFEVRTTVHSDLINEKEVEMMIDYLEKANYKGDYYIQHFINDVVTLEKLGYSSKQLNADSLSTKNIKVHLRG